MFLEKLKLNTTKVFIFKALIDSYINRDEFVSVNIELRDYNDMKLEIKNSKNAAENTIL